MPLPASLVRGVDATGTFRKFTASTPWDAEAERVFELARQRMARVLTVAPAPAMAFLQAGPATLPPVPGGVGYGVFYEDAFRADFDKGTAIEWQAVAPDRVGGNVSSWLYLTAMNRASKGVEAFISYYGQQDFHFKVFDWSREDHWQIDVPRSRMRDYLALESMPNGDDGQIMCIRNVTAEAGPGLWSNQVMLRNRRTGDWDLVYSHDYASTPDEQRTGWVGQWGPIVETFEQAYSGTAGLGTLMTRLYSWDGQRWIDQGPLTPKQSYLRADAGGMGFRDSFLEPNYSWVVKS